LQIPSNQRNFAIIIFNNKNSTEMKSSILFLFALAMLTSCQKEETKPDKLSKDLSGRELEIFDQVWGYKSDTTTTNNPIEIGDPCVFGDYSSADITHTVKIVSVESYTDQYNDPDEDMGKGIVLSDGGSVAITIAEWLGNPAWVGITVRCYIDGKEVYSGSIH
jgi:hypothetical protein